MRFLTLLLLSLFSISISQAQILDKIKKVKDKITENTVDKLSRDPITTSFKDVDKKLYIENDFGNEASYSSFFEQSFDPEQGFTLEPGFYEGTFQSFCIKAGTTVPIKGRGRFYAPIKGPKADIMEAIIKTYQASPEYTQREIQLLLWAIIAKTDFAKMKGPVKATALKILTPAQIARLSKGALDKLTRKELRKVANESPAIRAVLEAENNLRNKFYAGARTYQDYEEIAMRAGVEPIVPGFEAGRWTKHPDGFFIRYFPTGYQRTTTQVYVPETAGTTRFNPTNDIAVPPNSGQRLLQTSLPSGNPSSNTGGYVHTEPDPFCQPVVNAAADEAIKKQMIMQNIPGLAVAVYQKGEMVHLKAYGYSDIYKETPITLNTRMKWASISKSVTGVVAAQLEEKGVRGFKVTDDVTDYVENWDSVKYEDTTGKKEGTDKRHLNVKIDQLLSNSGGIQQYGKGSRKGDNKYYTFLIRGKDTAVVKFIENKGAYGNRDTRPGRKFKAKNAVNVFNESVLNDQPGMSYHYSSYGFVLAGAALDDVTPNGYWDWVKENIIRKAKLRSMRVGETPRPGHAMARDGMLTSYTSGFNEGTLPAGGFESDVCDLAKYAYALSRGEFFEKEENKDILWNNSVSFKTKPRGSTNYSYGLNYKGSGSNLRVYHGGHGGNVRSYMQFFPSDSTGIAIIAPAIYSNLPELTVHIIQAMGIRPGLYDNRVHTPSDACRTDMEDGEDLFHGVWRKTGDDVLVRTGIEKSGFFDEMERLKSSGYQVIDIETFKNGGKRYWDAVLKKGFPDTKLVSDLTLSQLKPKIQEMKGDGYIVTDIESYIAGNSGRLWGAVFSKRSIGNTTAFKKRKSDFLTEHQRNVNRGLKLVDVDVYKANNVLQYFGVWISGSDSEVELNIKAKDFFTKRDEMRQQGYRLVDSEYTLLNADNWDWRVSAVWEKGTGDEYTTGEFYDGDGDGKDDLDDNATLETFCEHMKTHHTRMKDYELIDWERMAIEWLDD